MSGDALIVESEAGDQKIIVGRPENVPALGDVDAEFFLLLQVGPDPDDSIVIGMDLEAARAITAYLDEECCEIEAGDMVREALEGFGP